MKIQIVFGSENSRTRTFPLTTLTALGCLYGGLSMADHWKLLAEGKTITVEYFSVQLRKARAQLNLSPLKCHKVHYIHDNAKTACGENNKVNAGNVQLDSSRSPTVQPRPCPY
uniref:Uncharacterized protein n=1 Tax=Caenorhabditis japonica TaxID=281687 RepID=A0A8R1IN43_CAEJA